MIPANLFTYATTDMSYAEQVAPAVSTPELQLNNNMTKMRSIDAVENNITEELADIAGLEDTADTYSLLLDNKSKEFSVIETQPENKMVSMAMETLRTIEDEQLTQESKVRAIQVDQSEALIDTESPDENYTGSIVTLSESDRDLLERLVMGEAGGEGMIGAALVAQAIHDTMIMKDIGSVDEIRRTMKYSGSIKKEPNEDVKEAVKYIFDDGGIAVKHKIIYFYAPKLVKSKFHESQQFIVEYKGHRFFSPWN